MASDRPVQVTVRGLPAWIDAPRLLGPGAWTVGDGAWTATTDMDTATDVAARLRGVSLEGAALETTIRPSPSRNQVRDARLQDARRRRDTTPGFTRPGVRLDEEGRWSLTPEALALTMGKAAKGAVVLDAGCGCGGNTIGFARAGCTVIAVERDAARLAMARHNAGVYGVADRVRFVHGDAAEVATSTSWDLLFTDPPWGVDWSRERTTLVDLPGLGALRDLAAAQHRALWAKVPPSFDARELPGAAVQAVFGEAPGDLRRIKFLLVKVAFPQQ